MRIVLKTLHWVYVTIAFRLIPLAILAVIFWFGYEVADAVARQFDERAFIIDQSESYPGTATALSVAAAVTATPTVTLPEPTVEPTDEPATATPTEPESSLEASPTLTVTSEPGATAAPSLTATEAASATATENPTATLSPSPEPTATIPPTDEPLAPAQVVFATNTPRPLSFATNTPSGPQPVATTEATSTPEPSLPPTATATIAATATFTAAPTETAAPTTRPLPTVLFAPAAEEGLISRGTAVPTPVEPVPRGYDLMNILLLGGDDSLTNDGFARTDTMIIVSINRDTNTVSMLSLPRDMFVWLPSGQMNRLNVAYAVGENIGWTGGGFGLLRQTILYNFGINVHYYARVNFDGFREVIDTVGGIEVAVDCAYQDYPLIGAEVPGPAIETGEDGLWTLPIGYYNMTGAEALWYARTRANADDFDRGRRQQQIIFAIWRKVRASGVLSITSLPGLWDQATSAVETDLDFLDIAGLLPLALSLDVNEVDNFYLTRTYHTLPWQTPEGDFVQLPIYETLRPLLEDFYQPPPESQLAVTRPTVRVFNGTTNASWDRVAGERLEWEGFPATSAGLADTTDYAETVLIDYTGSQRGSGAAEIARLLNIRPENIILEPRADREADFDVILGANYDSCDAAVLDVEAP